MNIKIAFEDTQEAYQRLKSVTIWALVFICIFFFIVIAHAQTIPSPATASYYTYKSCIREGTSGVWTASGEYFDENALTAAMWKVPFGTKVKITNLRNGKSVIVRINDRGPAKRLVRQGRMIDLSKGAFMKLASLKKGIIEVKVEIL